MVIFPYHSVQKTLILNMDWYDYGMILITIKTLEIGGSKIWSTISVIISHF